MALPLPERWRAPMGVFVGEAKRCQFLDLAMLEFSRDLLIAETCFQSEYLERPNARGKRRRSAKRGGYKTAQRFYVRLTEMLGWWQVLEKTSSHQPENL